MEQTCRRIDAWLRAKATLAVPLALVLSPVHPATATAADNAMEREQLAALARQIELADRLADLAANTAPQKQMRYHFDYVRLHADLKRVRAGLQDYLAPQRAQPRDPIPLSGDYTRSANGGKEASSP